MLKTQKNVKMNCTIFKTLKCFKIINKNTNFVIYKPFSILYVKKDLKYA